MYEIRCEKAGQGGRSEQMLGKMAMVVSAEEAEMSVANVAPE